MEFKVQCACKADPIMAYAFFDPSSKVVLGMKFLCEECWHKSPLHSGNSESGELTYEPIE